MIVIKSVLNVLILSFVASANTDSKFFEFPQIIAAHEIQNPNLPTMDEALKTLKEASDQARIAVDENSRIESKKSILKALADIGSYQFSFNYIERGWMDRLISTLLNTYAMDDEVAKAIDAKIGELTESISKPANRDSFLRFLRDQVQARISLDKQETWSRYLALLESSRLDASQVEILMDFYIHARDENIKQRAFERLYLVLMDPGLYSIGQSPPARLVSDSLKSLLDHEIYKKSLGMKPLSETQYQKIYDLFIRFGQTPYFSSLVFGNVITMAMRFAELESVSPEMKSNFEFIASTYGSKRHLMDYVFKDIASKMDGGWALSRTQQRVLNAVLENLETSSEHKKELREKYSKYTKTAAVLNILQRKRTTLSCRSFYGL